MTTTYAKKERSKSELPSEEERRNHIWSRGESVAFCGARREVLYEGEHPDFHKLQPCDECYWKAKQMGLVRRKDGWYQLVH